MVKLWLDAAKTIRMKTKVGELAGDGATTSFVCSENPTEVRKYSSTMTYGQLLVSGTDYSVTDNGDGTYTVTLTVAPAIGETVVALVGDQFLFEGQRALSNSDVEADRTLEQQVWLEAITDDHYDVVVAPSDLVAGVGADPAWFYLAPDAGGTPGTYGAAGASLSLGDVSAGTTVTFWAKCIVPLNTDVENYRDVFLKVTSEVGSTN